MILKEYQGKLIFNKYNIPIPTGYLIKRKDKIKDLKGNFVVKAQVLAGKRKKSGLIQKASTKNLKEVIKKIFNKSINNLKIDEILIERLIDIDKELYLSLIIDRFNKEIVCIFSKEGGIDIEEISKKYPKKIIKFPYDSNVLKNQFNNLKYKDRLIKIVNGLHKIMIDYDADLVEINPLVLSDNKLIALDSKITIDDNSLFRQEFDINETQKTNLEKLAKKNNLQYVELDGNVAVCGNGAGLVMATLDILNYHKIKPANFLDVGAGANVKTMSLALNLMLKKRCKAVFVNIFGGMTKCDEIAQGIVNYVKKIM